MTEHELQTAIIDYLLYHHWLVIRINSGVARPERETGERGFVPFYHWQVLGDDQYTSGVSDLLALKDGYAIVIEVKLPGNEPTPEQRRFMAEWRARGGLAIVAWSLDDVILELMTELGQR